MPAPQDQRPPPAAAPDPLTHATGSELAPTQSRATAIWQPVAADVSTQVSAEAETGDDVRGRKIGRYELLRKLGPPARKPAIMRLAKEPARTETRAAAATAAKKRVSEGPLKDANSSILASSRIRQRTFAFNDFCAR